MLRLTLLAVCLLVALQISTVFSESPLRERYARKGFVDSKTSVKNSTTVVFKQGHRGIHFRKANLPECHRKDPILIENSLGLKVVDYLQFDDISIADDRLSANVTRKNTEHNATITIEVTC